MCGLGYMGEAGDQFKGVFFFFRRVNSHVSLIRAFSRQNRHVKINCSSTSVPFINAYYF